MTVEKLLDTATHPNDKHVVASGLHFQKLQYDTNQLALKPTYNVSFNLHPSPPNTMSSKVAGKKRAQPTESDNEAEMEGDHQLSIAGDGSESGVKDKVGSSSSSKTEPQSKTTSKSKSGSGSKSKTKKRKQAPSPGIVYISRLPPGMTPQKVKHLMGRWGDVGKIYAQKKDGKPPINTTPIPLPTSSQS